MTATGIRMRRIALVLTIRVVSMGGLLAVAVAACGTQDDSGSTPLGERLDVLNRDLTIGSTGEDVRTVHEYLTRHGYFPNAKLGQQFPAWRPVVARPPAEPATFDENTRDAVRRFQTNAGMSPSGIVDEQTRSIMSKPRCAVPDNIPALDASDKFARFSSWLQRLSFSWKLSEANIPSSISLTNATIAAQAAMQTWAQQSSMSPTQVPGGPGSPNANVMIQFGTVDGGDGVAHGQTVTISKTTNWAAIDLQSVLLHELGHALGLRHSAFGAGREQAGVLMFPWIQSPSRTLFVDDMVGMSSLFDTYPKVTNTRAKDIGVGANGAVWIIDTTAVVGAEFGIRKFNGTTVKNGTAFDETVDFDGAVRIAVQPNGIPWVVQASGAIFRRTSDSPSSGTWNQICGAAKDIGIGADGSVWIVGAGVGDQRAFKWNGRTDCSAWDLTNGVGVRVSVAADGKPWVVADDGSIRRRSTASATGGTWETLVGRVADIGVSPDTSVFGSPAGYAWSVASASNGQVSLALFDEQYNTIGASGGSSIPTVKGWVTGNQFTSLGASGPAIAVAVGPNARPWVVNNVGEIFTSNQ